MPTEPSTRVTVSGKKASLSAVVAAWIAGLYGLIWLPLLLERGMGPAAILVSLVLGAGLVALSAIDLDSLRLPDAITIPLAVVGLLFAVVLGWEPSFWWRLGAATGGYVFIWAVGVGYKALRGQTGIGLGDAKLLAVAGAWLGLEGLPSTLLYACAGALFYVAVRIVSGRPAHLSEQLPFGPFIAAGIWLVWLYGPLGSGLG